MERLQAWQVSAAVILYASEAADGNLLKSECRRERHARAGGTWDYAGTAAPGCPAEQSSAVLRSIIGFGSIKRSSSFARPDRRGRLSPRGISGGPGAGCVRRTAIGASKA